MNLNYLIGKKVVINQQGNNNLLPMMLNGVETTVVGLSNYPDIVLVNIKGKKLYIYIKDLKIINNKVIFFRPKQ